jgi:hypothetical protein
MARPGIFFILILFFLLPGKMLFAQQSGDTLHANSPDTLAAPSDTFHLKEQLKKSDTLVITSADTGTSEKNVLALDTTTTKKFDPKVALLRSAIIPGWGQWYNKKYWKIPIIYGALGISAGVFFFNLKTYRELRQSVIYRARNTHADSLLVPEEFRSFSTQFLRVNRNAFRQNIDYSVLAFLALWGLNVVDATVDAHLKAFDVNDELSLQIKPGYSPLANTSGISLVLNIGKRNYSK